MTVAISFSQQPGLWGVKPTTRVTTRVVFFEEGQTRATTRVVLSKGKRVTHRSMPESDLSPHYLHGPEIDWKRWEGRRKEVTITLPVELVKWAKSNCNLSRWVEHALKRAQGGEEATLAELKAEAEGARAHLAGLEAQIAEHESALARRLAEQATETQREEFVAKLAKAFFAADRAEARFGCFANLSWVKSRCEHEPLMQGLTPESVLELILARKPTSQGEAEA